MISNDLCSDEWITYVRNYDGERSFFTTFTVSKHWSDADSYTTITNKDNMILFEAYPQFLDKARTIVFSPDFLKFLNLE
jgi:hypothetical protein